MWRAALLLVLPAVAAPQDPLPGPIARESFDRLHRMLVPTAEDLAGFRELPWELSVHPARVKAAAEDKPILVFLGSAEGGDLGARLAFSLIPAAERQRLVEYLKENYVLLRAADDSPGGSPDEVEWWKSVRGAGHAWQVATAGGRRLGDPAARGLPDLKGLRGQWAALPAETRTPKLATAAPPAPPAGALIVRVYFNYLDTPEAGEPTPVEQTGWQSEVIDQRFPATDLLWVTEKEWRSMVPAAPRAGEALPFPPTLKDRILKYYSAPELIGGSNADYSIVRAAEFTLTVDEASDAGFRLRLEGFARKGKAFDEKLTAPRGADFRFLGYLGYDSRKKAFDRFDVVALGRGWGGRGEGNGPFVEFVPIYKNPVRPYAVGLAFELVSGERPADRMPPGPGLGRQ